MYFLSKWQTLIVAFIVQTASSPIHYLTTMNYLTNNVMCSPKTCCDTRRQGELIIQATVISDCQGSTMIPPVTSEVMRSTTTTEEPESPIPETSYYSSSIQTTTADGQTTTTEEPESPIPETSFYSSSIQTTTADGQTTTTEEPESPIPETSFYSSSIQTTTADGQTTTTEEPESPIPETSFYSSSIQTTTADGQTTTTSDVTESPMPESSLITDPNTLPSEGTTTPGYCTPCCDTRRQGQVVIIASVLENDGSDAAGQASLISILVPRSSRNETMTV